MKKISFYSCYFLLIVVSGCNNQDDRKTTSLDSTKIAESKETVAPCSGFQLSAADAKETSDFLTQQYGIFMNTTKFVTYNYDSLLKFISNTASGNPTPSPDVELVFGALTKVDTARYISSHPTITKPDEKKLLNQVCLLAGYIDKKGNLVYMDKTMSLCPPPTSCQAMFTIASHMVKVYNSNPLDPLETISNFNITYDGGGSKYLTQSVKFNIETLKCWKEYFDTSLHMKALEINFLLGAYTAKDAKRNGQEAGKPCLLFAYKYGTDSVGNPKFHCADFGILVPQ
jgi:hypothetical protein